MAVIFTGRSVIQRSLQKTLQMTMAQVATVVDSAAKRNTPVKTGYTRKQWTKRSTAKNFEVANRVPWIERLEAGASKQAPRGIIGPTLNQIKGKIR